MIAIPPHFNPNWRTYLNMLARRKWLVSAAVALMAISGVTALSLSTKAQSQGAPAGPTPVSVAIVAARDIALDTAFSGHLEAVERVDLRPRVAGAILAIHFHEGALVRKGDLLVTIDPAPYAAEAARAAAQVKAAEARLTLATSEKSRADLLWADHAISQSDLEARVNDMHAAEAGLSAARAEAQNAHLNLSYTQVRAPISGRVGRIEVTVGNLVSAGPSSPILTTLVSVNPIYASFDADEATIIRTFGGLSEIGSAGRLERVPVTVSSGDDTGQVRTGHLQLIDNQFDSASGTVRARAVFDNADGRLIPGQFVRISLGEAAAHPALLINELAIGTDQSKRFVYVVGADKKVMYREVQLGAAQGGLRIVTAGLKAGDAVIVSGIQHVRPGAPVATQIVPMDAVPKS